MSDDREKLEKFVAQLVREQPLRRAPGSLEARVFVRIAAMQEPRSWWRRPFTHWPLAARIAFYVASFGFIKLALTGVVSLSAYFHSDETAWLATLHRAHDILSSTVSIRDSVLNAIPSWWLYGVVIGGFALYAALFGLGTLAYRTLYIQK